MNVPEPVRFLFHDNLEEILRRSRTVVPVNGGNDENCSYESGYSFESLREICEQAQGDGEINEEGTFLKESLDKLFNLVYSGFPTKAEAPVDNESLQGVFAIEPLKAHIFDPERTALIEKAHLRNGKLLQIINLMSLSRGGKGQRRGRISYSNLGVNQLGAVYEALLSYRGFFAEEDLYEVKRAGDKVDELDVGYFIPLRDLDQYTEDERVRNEDGTLRVHPKGEFIYRLAGREREKSASYYTPEVLTKCLVKYALKELLEGKTADEILELTICEPAMGSAAFLNEAVSQLAEAYLERKQKETGISIPHEQRQQELQKVKIIEGLVDQELIDLAKQLRDEGIPAPEAGLYSDEDDAPMSEFQWDDKKVLVQSDDEADYKAILQTQGWKVYGPDYEGVSLALKEV